MSTKFDQLFEQVKSGKISDSADSPSTFDSLFDQIAESKKTKSRPGKAFAREYTKGLLGTYGDIADVLHLQPKETTLPGQKALYEAEFNIPEKDLPFLQEDDIAPRFSRISSSEDVESLLNQLDIPKEEETTLEKGAGRYGRLTGAGSSLGIPAPISSAIAAGAGQLAEWAGGGPVTQTLSEIAGYLGPSAINALSKIGPKTIATTKSGLTQLPAVESKNLSKALITPTRQKKLVEKLNKEASSLTEKVLEKRAPSYKSLKEGFDFEKQFEQGFKEVRNLAGKANPSIEYDPIKSLFKKEIQEIKGVPSLDADSMKILKEIRSFGNKPLRDLETGLKTYRINNRKLTSLYEKSRLQGSQKKYADFLLDYNKAIAQSFKKTLPEDSKFVKLFEDTNKNFKNYKDAVQSESLLKNVLNAQPTPGNIQKIIFDPKLYKKLSMSLGEEGATEVRQIATDLRDAQQAIKKIPSKEMKLWGLSSSAAYALLPRSITGVITATKAPTMGRHVFGWMLTNPKTRRSYSEVLKAIKTGDRAKYIRSLENLSQLMEQGEQEEFE